VVRRSQGHKQDHKLTKTAGKKIIHNSFWYTIEMALETVAFFGTSVAVARYLGPAKLGYFSYINLFVTIITGAGAAGLSTATRKYMSDYIATDRLGTARAVYNLTYRYQLISAITISAIGVLGVLLFGDSTYRLMSSILLLSIVPGLMSRVPAQANQAFEDVSKNTISAFGYLASYVLVIVLTIYFRWDLPGVAAASLIGRTVEVFLRTIPLNRMLRTLPLATLDKEVVTSIRRFSLQAMGIQLLTSIVWDRSELFFLRGFSTLVQIGFYSISYTLTNNLLTPSRILGYSTGITLMVEAVKDPRRAASIVQHSCRYLLLIVCPLCFGAAAIMLPTVKFVYGTRYIGADSALIITVLLCMPRAFQWIPENLLRTADKQNQMLIWYSVTSVVNITLDFILIGHYRMGAVGAAWGNGLAQAFGVIAIWIQARRFYAFELPRHSLIRISIASAIMALIAFQISHRIAGFPGLALAILAAIASYFLLLGLLRALEPSDRERLEPLGNRLPAPARRAYLAALNVLTAKVTTS
jgi:O-antigen/teichoic acid export membrane protein